MGGVPFSPQDYHDRANENLDLAERLRASDDAGDRRWSVVALHYSAIQLINAGLLAAQYGDPAPPKGHDDRWMVFKQALEDHGIPDIARALAALNNLRNASQDARYEGRANVWWEQLETTEDTAYDSLMKAYQQIVGAVKGFPAKT